MDLGTGDVQRRINDLQVAGGVGGARLGWARTGHSRLIPGKRWFGDGHQWRHTYQWEMVSTGAGLLRLVKPDGNTLNFTLTAGVWKTTPVNMRETLTQSGTSYHLRHPNGMVYRFEQLTDSGGQTYFQLQDFTDRNGLTYFLTYRTFPR